MSDLWEPTARPALDYPAGPVDELLRRAARQWPERIAISGRDGPVTFAELDAAADRAAAAISALAAGPGHRVALATELSAAFAATFYGILRSGNVVVTVNPLYRPERVAATITAADAVVAVLTEPMCQQLVPMLGDLPMVLPLTGDGPGGQLSLAALAGTMLATPVSAGQSGDVACLHFTSGTTGDPKGVLLTHRNLVVNAAQTVQVHRLGPDSVTFNALPAYHLMHLNTAIYSGATQVLYGAPALAKRGTVADSVAAATLAGATHYYTLPMLLSMLAGDPGLASLQAPGLRGIFCGGSALPAPVAAKLSQQFGIPVIQGYGLAETSSLTHLDRPDDPRPGSVGVPVADTECRIVHVDTRAPQPAGQAGEVEVRGPQIMAGYAGGAPAVDSGGWLRTGDVGRIDPGGCLYLTDRLKDVFKSGNELISPSELEAVVVRHPAVRDCAVVDRSDPIRGAVPVALLVLAPAAPDPDDIIGYANDQLAPFQHLAGARIVDAIPRTPIGKIARRDLREKVALPA
jgi:long-chain acyl-CoA synthetase